ncbi:MAG: hypothetical protein K2Z81_17430, partial [Cyanobacteria bacterium]|nr:hypothetical protein [Cyanobacteriota bacterium]
MRTNTRIAVLVASIAFFFSTNAYAKEPDTIQQAIETVKAIQNPDVERQTFLRADKAREIVANRVATLNGGWGMFLQTLPLDQWNRLLAEGTYKSRSEAIARLRVVKGGDSVKAAWTLKAGMCYEHANLVKMILKGAGVDCQILTSNAPHDFPVVNLPASADADIPFTWGSKVIVPDSWENVTYSGPEMVDVLWKSMHHFQGGAAWVSRGTDRITTRQRLQHMVKGGKPLVQTHCAEYRKLVAKYNLIPQGLRPYGPTYPPKWCADEEESAGGGLNGIWAYGNHFFDPNAAKFPRMDIT